MAEMTELKVQITLTIGELQDLVAVNYIATDAILAAGQEIPEIVADVADMYADLMENLKDGFLGEFEPQ